MLHLESESAPPLAVRRPCSRFDSDRTDVKLSRKVSILVERGGNRKVAKDTARHRGGKESIPLARCFALTRIIASHWRR